jgi:hypothetical protein
MQDYFEYVEISTSNDCLVREVHINLFCPCVVDIIEGDRHSQHSKCHHLVPSDATERNGSILHLIF